MSHGTLSLFVKTPSWSRAPAPLCCDLVLFVGLGCAASLFLPVLAKRPSHELSMAHCAFVVRSICVTSASIPSDLDLFRCFPSIDAPNVKQREDQMPLLPLMAKRRMVATAVLVATLFLSAANIATAYHDDVDASTVNRAVMSCDDYSNDRSDYMKNTCSDGAGGKELPPPGQGAGGCDHGTLRCQSWDYVTKYAGCASFIQQFEDGITGGKKYCQKECCKRGEFFPSPAPSPPHTCTPCTNKPSPYMDG